MHDMDVGMPSTEVVARGTREALIAAMNRADAAEVRIAELEAAGAPFLGDALHPNWSAYIAANLLALLKTVKDTGDWYWTLRSWCERHDTGLQPCAITPVEEKGEGLNDG